MSAVRQRSSKTAKEFQLAIIIAMPFVVAASLATTSILLGVEARQATTKEKDIAWS